MGLIDTNRVMEITGLNRVHLQHYVSTGRIKQRGERKGKTGRIRLFDEDEVKAFRVSKWNVKDATKRAKELGAGYEIKHTKETIVKADGIEINEIILLYKDGVVVNKVKTLLDI